MPGGFRLEASGLIRKGHNAKAAFLGNGEVADPVDGLSKKSDGKLSHMLRGTEMRPQKDDSRYGRLSTLEGHFTEVLVKRQQYSALGSRQDQYGVIAESRGDVAHPANVHARQAGSLDRSARYILIGQELRHESYRQRVNVFLLQHFDGIVQRRLNVLLG